MLEISVQPVDAGVVNTASGKYEAGTYSGAGFTSSQSGIHALSERFHPCAASCRQIKGLVDVQREVGPMGCPEASAYSYLGWNKTALRHFRPCDESGFS